MIRATCDERYRALKYFTRLNKLYWRAIVDRYGDVMNENDQRPSVAVGHISIEVSSIGAAADSFVRLGMRHIHQTDSIAVLELRGGTHLVLRKVDDAIEASRKAPFDLMVDDIDVARTGYLNDGFSTTEISRGQIHDSFTVTGPDEYAITITSSHAGNRAV